MSVSTMRPGDLPVTRGWHSVDPLIAVAGGGGGGGTHKQRPIHVRLSVRPTTSARPTDTRNGTFTRHAIKNLIHIPTDTIRPVTKIAVSPKLPCNNTGAVNRVALPVGASPSAIKAAKTIVTAVPLTVGATAVPPAVTGEQIRIVLMNAQSVRNKTMLINEYVRDDDIDILAITETWLKRGGDSAIITELAPDGYSFVHVPRQRGRGGGVGLLHRETYSCKLLASPCFKHMELLRARLTGTNVRPFDVYVVYHPHVSTKNSGTLTDFITELETLFNAITLSVVPAIVVGDFNIHYDDPSKADKLIDLLDNILV